MKNYGFQIPEISAEDYHFGALPQKVLNPSGDWRPHLPFFERQKRGLETQACVSFGTLSAVEMLHKLQYGTEPNYSDRFLATTSETTRTGNNPKKVADALRNKGVVTEKHYPYLENASWEEFYAPISEKLLELGKEWADYGYDFGYEWVDDTREALKYSPVGVAVHAWRKNNKGEYVEGSPNHWCVLVAYDGDNPVVFDTYDEGLKTLTPNYDFRFAMRYTLVKRTTPRRSNWLVDLFRRILSIFT